MKNKLSELIDIEKVSELLEGFNKATGFVTAILNLEGNILSKSGWRKICTDFHRSHPETSEKCKISDTILANKVEKDKKYQVYTCLNGLTDVAVPLEINDQHVGYIFSGQFFFEKPDIAFFKKQAKKYGFDEKEYVQALEQVPVVSEDKAKTIIDFLLRMTSLISELGFKKTKQVELNKRLTESEEELKVVNQQLAAQNQQLIANKQELEKEKVFSEKLVETAEAIIVGLDKDHIIKIFNRGAEDITGYKKEEVIGKDWFKIFFPKENLDIMNKVWKESWGIKSHSYINAILVKSGKEKIISWQTTGIYDSDDESKHLLLSIGEDITERKEAEEAMRKGEQKFRSYIENSPHGIFITDDKGNYIEVNEAAGKITGYSKEELVKMNLLEMIPVKEHEKAEEHFKTVFKTGKSVGDLQYVKKNGSFGYWTVSAIKLNKNRFLGFVTDITERKQAEEKMRFLSAITENMHDSIIVTDLQGHITYINKSTEKLFGYTQDELAGKNTEFLNIDSRAEEIEAELYETVAKGEVYQGEALNQRKDGSEFICEFTVAPLTDEKGVVSSYIGIQRDITEIRNLENAAIKQERLSAIGELASGVAHDFNNALQIILGGVEMALASEEPEELNQYLESIKHSASDAASRVRRLQRFSQKRQPKRESVPININNLAEDVIKETKLWLNQFQKQGIHLEIKSDYKARSNIEGNEGELRSCLFNLVKNSTEAMPEGGKITVSTDEYDNKIYVSVSDTGTGMDKETQKKIFQPFYSTKGFEPGRGLGMTQVYSAIRDHNGDIYIKESEIGKGTVIEFALPVSKKELILEKNEEDYVGTAKILWVDDEEMILKICGKMLKNLGHTGEFAANGKEALELLAKGNKYDLVITDIGMPGMSGWQLAEQIKNRGYATKIAVVTGWGAEVSQEEKNRYNVGYVLGKPINLKKLKALIGEVLQMKNLSE